MAYELAQRETCRIEGIAAETYAVGPARWTCVSHLEHTPVQSFVTTLHPTREAAIAHMTALLAAYFDAEVARWN